MLRKYPHKKLKGQVLLEYTVVIGAIVLALLAMNDMIKRGIQGMIKVTADQIGNQEGAEQRFDEGGHMKASYSSTRAASDTTREEFLGVTRYVYEAEISSSTNTVSNLGLSE